MNKIYKFLLLELIAIRRSVSILFILVVCFMSIMGYMVSGLSGMVLGVMPLLLNLSTQPFALGKDGMDTLYAALDIRRSTVVVGRYIFVLILCIASGGIFFFAGAVVSIASQDLANLAGFGLLLTIMLVANLLSCYISFPIFFKIGYKKGRMLALLFPFVIMGFIALISMNSDFEVYPDVNFANMSMDDLSGYLLGHIGGLSLYAAMLPLLLFIIFSFLSCMISIKLYNGRDF